MGDVNLEIGQRITSDYQSVAVLENASNRLYADIVNYKHISDYGLPQYSFDPPEIILLGESLDNRSLARLSTEKTVLELKQKNIELRISETTKSLAELVLGKVVKVEPLADKKFAVDEYFKHSGIGESIGVFDSITGRIAWVQPKKNSLGLWPVRGALGASQSGLYELPVIDNNGKPLISISESVANSNPNKFRAVLRKLINSN